MVRIGFKTSIMSFVHATVQFSAHDLMQTANLYLVSILLVKLF